MARQPSPFDFGDFQKLLAEYQMPGVDWQQLIASQQKNLAALTQANQVLMQGAQAVMQREVEILQKAMAEAVTASRELMAEGDPQAGAAKRFELARTSFETAITNMRELAELASKSNSEALEVINRRAVEAFDEVQAAVAKQRAGEGGAKPGAEGGAKPGAEAGAKPGAKEGPAQGKGSA